MRAAIPLTEDTSFPRHGAQSVDTRHLHLRPARPSRPSHLNDARADDRLRVPKRKPASTISGEESDRPLSAGASGQTGP